MYGVQQHVNLGWCINLWISNIVVDFNSMRILREFDIKILQIFADFMKNFKISLILEKFQKIKIH